MPRTAFALGVTFGITVEKRRIGNNQVVLLIRLVISNICANRLQLVAPLRGLEIDGCLFDGSRVNVDRIHLTYTFLREH